jgi:GNAT superfamily N-acetyltransferase
MPTDEQGTAFPPIRRLGLDDLPRCVALAADRGWSPERAKWSLLLTASEVFGVDAPDGRGLAGSVTLTRWGTGLASVGMMLVATRCARRGLGQALMEHLLCAAGEGTTVTLFATDMGRPLYEKLGFRAIRRNVSFTGQFRPDRSDNSKRRWLPAAVGGRARLLGQGRLADPGLMADPGPLADPGLIADPGLRPDQERLAGSDQLTGAPESVRLAVEADLPAILDIDRAAFGADRGGIITRLPGFADRMAVFEAGHGVEGFAAAWRNGPASTVIGPVVAPDGEAARKLIAGLAARTSTRVRLDLDPDRPELPGWAHAHGLEPVGTTAVMAYGGNPPIGIPERLFTPVSVALA